MEIQQQPQSQQQGVLYVPPEMFGIVQDGIFRSNAIEKANFGFLSTLNLKTLLLLSPEAPTREVMGFLRDHHVKLIHMGLNSWKPSITGQWRPTSEELIKEGLETALDTRNHPILLSCTLGIHETGTLVGCLRKLMDWNYNSIVVEYRSFAGNRARYINEQFVELFDLDLITLPPKQYLPIWLIIHNQE